MKKNQNIKFYLIIMLVCLLNTELGLTEEVTGEKNNDFSIVDVRCLGRNHRDGELTVIYVAVKCENTINLPMLDLFYTISNKEKIPDTLGEKIFNITPMFCLDTELMHNNDQDNNTHLYRAEIPPKTNGLIVEYFIAAKNSQQKQVFYPSDAPLSLNNFTISGSKNPFLK
ncbi:MAG: hypothetical protein A2161_01040 [Candidatus Schekmanbacteria bacterium RBG_13_48_7]|uniref:Uncharacterized protein n=1 Tax=Candidatus Schekmanbacteria bacterium RBG_13_48_7 TaxID=1817878 RepID=A0A1F7S0V2_9BACT|nr:MAG: hypothetical protein A2161_01040 [Candidatus Schekmanbacteria bacterium RBG_13_48_7]